MVSNNSVSTKSNSRVKNQKYERTLKGKLVRTYSNMKSRVSGKQKHNAHLYNSLDILPKDDFYEWSLKDPEYNRLHKEWAENNYDIKISPSIDRKNNVLGYTLDNMQWITHSENSRKGAINRHTSITYVLPVAVVMDANVCREFLANKELGCVVKKSNNNIIQLNNLQ